MRLLVAVTELMAGLLTDCRKMWTIARTKGFPSTNEGIRRRERYRLLSGGIDVTHWKREATDWKMATREASTLQDACKSSDGQIVTHKETILRQIELATKYLNRNATEGIRSTKQTMYKQITILEEGRSMKWKISISKPSKASLSLWCGKRRT